MQPPETPIKVHILAWMCLNENKAMALTAMTANQDNKLVIKKLATSDPDPNQQWILVPNLSSGASFGGYTLYNVGKEQSVEIVRSRGEWIKLSDDRTPYGSPNYAWLLFSAGIDTDGNKMWAIQVADQGGVMDVYDKKCDPGTPVKLYDWHVGGSDNDNQVWVVRRFDQSTLAISLAGGHPTPDGDRARMSRTGDGFPNQATFTAKDDRDYCITLEAGPTPTTPFWKDHPNGHTFTVKKGKPQGPFQLDPAAPVGLEPAYSLKKPQPPAEGSRSQEPRDYHPPKMFIDP